MTFTVRSTAYEQELDDTMGLGFHGPSPKNTREAITAADRGETGK